MARVGQSPTELAAGRGAPGFKGRQGQIAGLKGRALAVQLRLDPIKSRSGNGRFPTYGASLCGGFLGGALCGSSLGIAGHFSQLAGIIGQTTAEGVKQFEGDIGIFIGKSRGRASHFDLGGQEEKIVRLIGFQFQAAANGRAGYRRRPPSLSNPRRRAVRRASL